MEPFLGEIRLFAYGISLDGWLPCDGRILQTSNYQALSALLGNRYGGTNPTTFALPDLRGRVMMMTDFSTLAQGATGGAQGVTLAASQIPPHRHGISAFSAEGNGIPPNGNFPSDVNTSPIAGAPPPPSLYRPYVDPTTTPLAALNPASIGTGGGGAAHLNVQPSRAMPYYIAVQGLWPPRN